MKRILITGKGDKRIISYPFMFYADQTGKTCVVTDDLNYRRLFDGYGNEGDIDNVHIKIFSMFREDDDLNRITDELESEGYDTVIFILDAHIAEAGFDKTVVVTHQLKTFLGEDIEEVIEDTPNTSVCCFTLRKIQPAEGISFYLWQPEDFMYMYSVEEQRKLLPPGKKLRAFLKPAIESSLPSLPGTTYDRLAEKGGR